MTPLSILYVDDDPDIRTVVRLALGLDPAMTLTEAASADAALALVDAGLRPDLALVDAMMPTMTGPVLMEQLHARPATAHLPVIVITAKARAADIAAYRARGALGVISKPFDPLRLAREIRELLRSAGS